MWSSQRDGGTGAKAETSRVRGNKAVIGLLQVQSRLSLMLTECSDAEQSWAQMLTILKCEFDTDTKHLEIL